MMFVDQNIKESYELGRMMMLIKFHCKLGWRILIDNDIIWMIIMRDKYVKNNDFFNIPKKAGDFNVWKEIINYRKYVELT